LYDSCDEETSTSADLEVDVIAERDGQKLRGFIMDSFRDLQLHANKKYRLSVRLEYVEKPCAFTTDGNAKRVRMSYIANLTLKNEKGECVFTHPVSISSSSNISSAQGEVVFSLYGRNNHALLKELGNRIVENVKVFVASEN